MRYRSVRGASIPVLHSAGLGQIDVPYDTGAEEHLDMPGFGVNTARLRPSDCPDGQRVPAKKPVLCATIEKDGLRGEWSDYDFGSGNHAFPGSCLAVYTVTPADWYTYMNKWRLCDDGSVQALVGAGGTLSPHTHSGPETGQATGPGDTNYATAHFHNVFWRLDFGLGGAGQQVITQVDDTAVGAVHKITTEELRLETARRVAPSRVWRVSNSSATNSDMHAVALDIDLQNGSPYRDAPDHAFTDNDFYVTQYQPCERLAANNRALDCGASVTDYTNSEPVTHPIVWVQNGFHHLPRDEDEPMMNQHWQSISLSPRGFTAINELEQNAK